MFRSSWLQNVLGLARYHKDRRPASQQRRSVQPTLETLEDRIVPSGSDPSQSVLAGIPNTGGGSVPAGAAATATPYAAPMAAKPVAVDVSADDLKPYYYVPTTKLITLTAEVSDANKIPVKFGRVTFTIEYFSINKDGTESNQKATQVGYFSKYKNPDGIKKGEAPISLFVTKPFYLPVLYAGRYLIDVKYEDLNSGRSFKDDGTDGPGVIEVYGRQTSLQVFATSKTQGEVIAQGKDHIVFLRGAVKDATNPGAITVNEGVVTFSPNNQILPGGVNGTGKFPVQGGQAKTEWKVPKAGKYTIDANYFETYTSAKIRNFYDSNSSITVDIIFGTAGSKANPDVTPFSPNSQTVMLSANVADLNDSSVTIDEGTLTFTVAGIGTVQGQVVDDHATALLTIPAGEAPGHYAIAISYSDSSGDYIDGGDVGSTLTIKPPPPPPPPPLPPPCTPMCLPTAQNALIQAFEQLISDIESLIAQFLAAESNLL